MVNVSKSSPPFKLFNHTPSCMWLWDNPFLRVCVTFSKCVFIDSDWKNITADTLQNILQSHRQRWAAPGEASAKIRRESSSLEASQAPGKDTAVDGCLDSENSETIEALSSVLHANPHVSIRDSLKRGEDIPFRPTRFKRLFCLHSVAVFAPNWEEAILLCSS